MPYPHNLTLADSSDLAAALAYALRYQDRKRVHNAADGIMAEIVAKRVERAGFVVMKRPAEVGAAALRPLAEGLRPIPQHTIEGGAGSASRGRTRLSQGMLSRLRRRDLKTSRQHLLSGRCRDWMKARNPDSE
jgi:hypothetical protein